MKQYFIIAFLALTTFCGAQSLIQTVNSGGIISTATMASVGEIVVIPETPSQSASGIIGILAQNDTTLEVEHFEMSSEITVYPNPTTAVISFKTDKNLSGKKMAIYSNDGKFVGERMIDSTNSLDLQGLQTGIYILRPTDKNLKSFKIIKY